MSGPREDYRIDDAVYETGPIVPHRPDPSKWAPYDHWRMQSPRAPYPSWRYWNSRYSITIRPEKQKLIRGTCWRMIIMRDDQSAHHDYRDYMRIKDDLFGPEYEAIELYPRRSRETDPSNAFVLFVFANRIPIGDQDKLIASHDRAMAPQRKFSERSR